MSRTPPLELLLILIPLVAIIAGAYASVGLGGGTGYLAVMSLLGVPTATMAPTALLLNLVVTTTALISFGWAGRLRWRLFLPFLLPAIPTAFLGGSITANRTMFLALLAIALAIAAIAMFRSSSNVQESEFEPEYRRLLLVAIPSGFLIGFLSGFLGIGGGVFLGPLLLFLGWTSPKQVPAMNSAIVLILSAIGLAAHGIKGQIDWMLMLPLAIAALIGGLVGATLAEKKLSGRVLQRVFAVIILIAAIKAFLDAIPK